MTEQTDAPKLSFSPATTGARCIHGVTREYSGISRDSRAVQTGDVFYCLSDDINHINDAIKHGAGAIVTAQVNNVPEHIALYHTDGDIREHLAKAAALCYPSPNLKHSCAVTGTNGKTSVAHIYRSLMAAVGAGALSVGTLGMIPEGGNHNALPSDFGLTTPDPITLHKALHDYSEHHGISALCIEASSHGLDQRRCDGVRFNAAIFTNFTDDHLDYHKTKDAYLTAKRRIFALTNPGGLAIINADMPECALLLEDAKRCDLRPLTVGYSEYADVRISDQQDTKNGGQSFTLTYGGKESTIQLSLNGAFQAYNACFAVAAAIDAFPDKAEELYTALAYLPEIPGRMQRVMPAKPNSRQPAVYVDFAHTPDALVNAAQALKKTIPGRLIIVVGCGGDRDRDKRPVMGKAAADYADRVIITDDNPRTENPAVIRDDVMQGCPSAENIAPREAAIAAAFVSARADDTILIAGKGHENYQIIGTEKTPFSDSEVARVLLDKI